MGSLRRADRDPTPTRFRDPAKRQTEGSEPLGDASAATESQKSSLAC
ncbi:hypothetical protein APTSU1_000881000 [Apodemus speciosus]|uniref:Uncharacterized protein n=1 Tax=Apodemus speciosus TaxID=105296 RepID=A0ABQ0F2R3_APOSI